MPLALITDLIAIGLLTAIAVAAVVTFVWWWKSSRLSLVHTLMWMMNYLIAKLLWGAQVDREFPVPPGQGAVIVGNHLSSIDPSFIQTSVRRVIYWMVAREYCESGFAGWLLRKFQVIPVSRAGIDTAGMKLAIRLAQQGGLIGIFPEGRINETREQLLLPGRPGAALVALKARVPIIPMYISGSPYDGTPLGALRMRAQARVKVGQPIDLTPYFGREKEEGVTQEITRLVMREIARLAGQPNFEPQLAGRRWKNGENEIDAASGGSVNGGQAVAQNNGKATAAAQCDLSQP